jgi:hypothetical protein
VTVDLSSWLNVIVLLLHNVQSDHESEVTVTTRRYHEQGIQRSVQKARISSEQARLSESQFASLSFSLIPAQCKSFQAYKEAFWAFKSAARCLNRLCATGVILKHVQLCDRRDCETCRCIQQVRENPKVVAATSTDEYIKNKKLTIVVALSDNSAAWQKFAKDTLGLAAVVCQTHRHACDSHCCEQRLRK